ncbi:type VI secretion protein [Rhodovarius crocodyli]|uniref:Type VI secretion protein n=1 Tax=Rhodovarius crocodyli TaxID=1979269 RepID=A0A437MES4_9PROT|nr:PAAR domain-containing protein [Rhodovarius crocodyli]RVT96115.1 type VI secretion protein [Rhodovarius crocodyli]
MAGPPQARLTDLHTCLLFSGPVPHVGGPIGPPCSPNVLVGKLPAARVTDLTLCVPAIPDPIVKGSMTVLINSLPAARIGDLTSHGGVIVMGFPTVLTGG